MQATTAFLSVCEIGDVFREVLRDLPASEERPGRIVRKIAMTLPDINVREEILQVKTRKMILAPEVDLRAIAAMAFQSSGADFENLVNEVALTAGRERPPHRRDARLHPGARSHTPAEIRRQYRASRGRARNHRDQ
ncbi:hypothetical protein [Roseivivax halodurans]|uniref:hypothetical protein n=1 Tax=Roseivivax halodurans TaxID=93683 RepID=UPI0004BAE79D|nr:hypothetical protein [Roseivivax halodurans]